MFGVVCGILCAMEEVPRYSSPSPVPAGPKAEDFFLLCMTCVTCAVT